MRGITRDISERKWAEEKLRAASLYTRSLIEASLDPLVTISSEGNITDVNRATEQVTGVSRERFIGDDITNYFTEPEKAREGYQKVLGDGSVRDYPLTFRHTPGKTTDALGLSSIDGTLISPVVPALINSRRPQSRGKMAFRFRSGLI
jgi:PAS domain-containing protein